MRTDPRPAASESPLLPSLRVTTGTAGCDGLDGASGTGVARPAPFDDPVTFHIGDEMCDGDGETLWRVAGFMPPEDAIGPDGPETPDDVDGYSWLIIVDDHGYDRYAAGSIAAGSFDVGDAHGDDS